MHEYFFRLTMPAHEVEQVFYRTAMRHIIITAENGMRIQLALKHLVPFITRHGIEGRFRLRTNLHHKFISLEAIS